MKKLGMQPLLMAKEIGTSPFIHHGTNHHPAHDEDRRTDPYQELDQDPDKELDHEDQKRLDQEPEPEHLLDHDKDLIRK
jgi:hypothetical protein